ncbi:hypothetical protein JS533_001605 [Bifidobacterium amazonense]|uniref:Uncharacterized protein n=1 Tax=Bifidobacterium amazonense TaxID=2809027 RepID=A0ABS9VSM5_9BIFI|nr:hypothetical protein [Bifidobacterium amazonense]MCH9274985.1 hypothetical protein [Bifidobacterium amazonense]
MSETVTCPPEDIAGQEAELLDLARERGIKGVSLEEDQDDTICEVQLIEDRSVYPFHCILNPSKPFLDALHELAKAQLAADIERGSLTFYASGDEISFDCRENGDLRVSLVPFTDCVYYSATITAPSVEALIAMLLKHQSQPKGTSSCTESH